MQREKLLRRLDIPMCLCANQLLRVDAKGRKASQMKCLSHLTPKDWKGDCEAKLLSMSPISGSNRDRTLRWIVIITLGSASGASQFRLCHIPPPIAVVASRAQQEVFDEGFALSHRLTSKHVLARIPFNFNRSCRSDLSMRDQNKYIHIYIYTWSEIYTSIYMYISISICIPPHTAAGKQHKHLRSATCLTHGLVYFHKILRAVDWICLGQISG